ncbi:LOW QUALITY PROTEIN: nuclear GTPase SLIP-GC-like [Ciconia maguari]
MSFSNQGSEEHDYALLSPSGGSCSTFFSWSHHLFQKKLPSDSKALHKADLLYMVSAQEYWKGKTLNKEETEIPKLREYLTFYVAQKRNMLMDYVTEVLVIFSLIQSLQSNQDAWRAHGHQGYHRTLKAVCLKKEVYASQTFCRIDINDPLAQPIYGKIDMSFGNIFRIQMGACSTPKVCLDTFKDAMQQQPQKAMMKYLVADIKYKLRFLQQELRLPCEGRGRMPTAFIIRETEKVILQKKAEIYHSPTVPIQNDLLPCYEDAARRSGVQAYKRMQTVLSKGIKRELERGMLEKAQVSMRRHFQDLKVEIIKMKKDFPDTLSLAFCPWDQFNSKLPDLQNEFFFIHTIHENLHSARDA